MCFRERTKELATIFEKGTDLRKITQIRNIERPQEYKLLSPKVHFYFFGSLHSII